MSLKYRNGQGVESPISGLNGTSGELIPSVSYYQQGQSETTSVEANVGKPITITFSTPMPDADYVVALGNFAEYCYFSINDKATSGFKVYVRPTTSSANFKFSWQAFKLMTEESIALDEQAIADIQDVIPSTATSANKLATATDITNITDLIPSSASSSNQLVTVNDLETAISNINALITG